jgi:O-methyltransferase involved in polyketide biosynthesis
MARYRWNTETKALEEVPAGWTGADPRAQVATEELVYGGTLATDGTRIDTRKRHRDYLKSNGLAMASDFSGQWESQAKEREAFRTGRQRDPGLRAQLGRAMHDAESQRRKKH